ncbi:MAG: ATP-binding protein [Gammaproteobacteria bacterium]|nr:ATP-binding protein [Gammaproteobacteria bacterium]MDP2347947.1 ATP-binding protein [Gammaproteobacteria bacterium]
MNKVLMLANAVLALIMFGGIAFQSISDRQRVYESAYTNLENITEVMAMHTQQTLAAVDLGLSTVVDRLEQIDVTDAAVLAEIYALLVQRQESSVSTYSLYISDAEGRIIATSRQPEPDTSDLTNNAEFSVHRDGLVEGLFIGTPRMGVRGLAADQWVLALSRGYQNQDGSFAGVVATTLSVPYLLDFYDALRLGEQGAVGLLNSEQRLLVRSPMIESFMGVDISMTSQFMESQQTSGRGLITDTYTVQGIRRISSFRNVWNDQLIAYANLAEEEVFAEWRERLYFRSAMGVLLMLLAAGGSVAISLYFSRRQRWAEETSRRLRLLAEGSASLVQCSDITALLHRVTEIASELIGAHQAFSSLLGGDHFRDAMHAVVLSDKYEKWRDYKESLDGTGIYRLVSDINKPMLMTQAELLANPAWKGFGAARDRHPPMRGWLAVPIVSQDGRALGIIQLSDKIVGDFNTDDLHEMVHLASVTGIAVDNLQAIAAREAALEEVTAAKAEIESIFTSISDAVYALDPQWRFVYMNAEAEKLLERAAAGVMGKVVWDEFPETRQTVLYGEYLRARRDNTPVNFEFFYPPLQTWFSVRAYPHTRGLTVYFQDITRRIETDERLRQSQKMDAIGQLTGGVAHDFNNLLTVILGNADAVEEYLVDAPESVRSQAQIIRKAGERAADLTHRLLAFARRQPLDPKRTNINELITDVEGMLRRTLGETVSIELVRGSGLWQAVVDPHELENAILNLAINARDAMPEGGKLTIETGNMAVDQNYADMHQIQAGQYVLVGVSDTGTGMSPALIAKAFDPFFTTKPEGKGAGLGLSMVYGFARQSGGHVKIYSEMGEGTTIKLYLPRAVDDTEVEYRRSNKAAPAQRGTERILVVEDDELVRRHTVESLRRLGYTVTDCADGPEAMAHLDSGEVFDMLLTDVVLAGGMSGKRVAIEALARAPTLKLLYMSGYTENAIVHHGRLDRGVALLSKPFRLVDLARKVRDVLDDATG